MRAYGRIYRKEYLILIALTALAAGIRLWKLGTWSFWADEAFTVQDTYDSSHPFSINPLIYWVTRLFIDILGISEWSARIGPCIIGILTIPALYFPTRAILNRKIAVIVALFTALSPWHLFWSQNARGYSFTFLFAGLATFTFYLALETDNLKFSIFAFIFVILSILSHVLSVMLVAAMAAYVILLWLLPIPKPVGLRWRNLIIFFGPFLCIALIFLFPKYFHYLTSDWGRNQGSRTPLYILFTLICGVGIPTCVIAALLIFDKLREFIFYRSIDRACLLLLCYTGIPLIICLCFSPILNIAGYYLFFTTPAYFALAAWGCAVLFDATPRNKLLGIAATAMIAVTFLSQNYLYFQFENGGRSKWREALYVVKTNMKPEDLVVTAIPRLARYYLPEATIVHVKDVMSDTSKFAKEWRAQNQTAWIIVNERSFRTIDANMKFRKWLYTTSHLIAEYPLYARVMNRAINVYKFR